MRGARIVPRPVFTRTTTVNLITAEPQECRGPGWRSGCAPTPPRGSHAGTPAPSVALSGAPGVRGNADPLEFVCRERGDHLLYRIHALAPHRKHLVERGGGIVIEPETGGIGQERPGESPGMVWTRHLLNHAEEPDVGGKDEMPQRLDKAPVVVDPLKEQRLRQRPSACDGGAPDLFDHRPGIGQSLRVDRPQLHPLGEAAIQLGLNQRSHLDAVDAEPADIPGDVGIAQPSIGDPGALKIRRVQPCSGEVGVVQTLSSKIQIFPRLPFALSSSGN